MPYIQRLESHSTVMRIAVASDSIVSDGGEPTPSVASAALHNPSTPMHCSAVVRADRGSGQTVREELREYSQDHGASDRCVERLLEHNAYRPPRILGRTYRAKHLPRPPPNLCKRLGPPTAR